MGGSIEWVGTKQAGARLGLTAPTLYRLIHEGHLPAYRFGRVIRVKMTDLDAFIASCRIEPGSHPGTLVHLDRDGDVG